MDRARRTQGGEMHTQLVERQEFTSRPRNTRANNIIIKAKLRGFGPRTNYTDRLTAACWRS
jgi:hypothetical protein